MLKHRIRRALDYAWTLLWFFALTPVAALARRLVPSMKGLWLVMERGNDARDNGYWFYRYHYTIMPVLLMIPVFALLGYAIPAIMYRHAAKQSVVERLRDTES